LNLVVLEVEGARQRTFLLREALEVAWISEIFEAAAL
jgi:hypothetical protein